MGNTDIPKGLCQCGCGQPAPLAPYNHKGKGWIAGEPLRFIAQHQRRKSPVEYIVDLTTGCWEWQRSKNLRGYGQYCKPGSPRPLLAHRVYFEQKYGPIPEGLEPDHLCRNPGCVNPDHLELVSHAENIRRGKNTRLDWNAVRRIRLLRTELGLTFPQLAAMFDVAPTTISSIINRYSWKEAAA